jgi:hypothetical protein
MKGLLEESNLSLLFRGVMAYHVISQHLVISLEYTFIDLEKNLCWKVSFQFLRSTLVSQYL